MAKIVYNPDQEGGWDISNEGEQIEKLNHGIDLHWRLKRLPPRIKGIAELILEGYNYKEIGDKLGLKEDSIKKAVYRHRLSTFLETN